MEQALVVDSVKLIPEEGKLEASFPFIENPIEVLKPNRFVAEKILESQLKIYSKYPEMREDMLKSHDKLLLKRHVLPRGEKKKGFHSWRGICNSMV